MNCVGCDISSLVKDLDGFRSPVKWRKLCFNGWRRPEPCSFAHFCNNKLSNVSFLVRGGMVNDYASRPDKCESRPLNFQPWPDCCHF